MLTCEVFLLARPNMLVMALWMLIELVLTEIYQTFWVDYHFAKDNYYPPDDSLSCGLPTDLGVSLLFH